MSCRSILLIVMFSVFGQSAIARPLFAQEKLPLDPLPSWNDRKIKDDIIDFVRAVTTKTSPHYVPSAERIATFDNDGTLWVEQPLYPQVVFAADRVKSLASRNPGWKTTEPFKAILTDDRPAMEKLTRKEYIDLIGATHAGMSTDQFHVIASDWLATAKHPRYKRPYPECVYKPMLEVMGYLRDNGFRTYIVTGGGQQFVRAFSQQSYGIGPEHVIGSALRTKYIAKAGMPPMLMRLPSMLLIDDEEGKPEDIELFIGRKPLAAFGNSTGDRQMLEWTQSGSGKRLMLLVHHDDSDREYAYGPDSKIGAFPESLMEEANHRGWLVASMKHDWKRVFTFGTE